MKWLATAILCLLAMPALAEDDLKGIIKLPSALLCGEYDPENDKRILEQYGEIPFVQGDGEVLSPDINKSYQGVIKFYLDPNDHSYSVFIEINNEITCLITTGEKLKPIKAGDSI
jgi:hypothetical protein